MNHSPDGSTKYARGSGNSRELTSYLGRKLRGLLLGHGFIDVEATTKYISYGTRE